MTTLPAEPARVRNWRVRVEVKREDCWVGVFWRTERTQRGSLTTWWICLLPMLPIVIQRNTIFDWSEPRTGLRPHQCSDGWFWIAASRDLLQPLTADEIAYFSDSAHSDDTFEDFQRTIGVP